MQGRASVPPAPKAYLKTIGKYCIINPVIYIETKPIRKNIRLKDFDYTLNEAYFITLVVGDRNNYFGSVTNNDVALSKYGNILKAMLIDLPKSYTNTEVYDFVIMPNHLHAVILLQNTKDNKHSLPYIIRSF